MAQVRYTITFEAGALMELSTGINAAILPVMRQTVAAVAAHTDLAWKESVNQAKLWSVEKDRYRDSIRWRMTGDFSAIVEADYENAEAIETGRPARDLKKMLDTSLKVRRTDGGKRFLVIPFRHNASGAKAMPSAVSKIAKGLEASRVTGAGLRPSGEVTMLSPKTGMHPSPTQTPYLSNPKTRQHSMTARMSYAWGGRLSTAALKQAGMKAAEARKYAGMVRMDTSTPGGAKSSAYMTFRIMMEGQTGKWVVPAQPGLYLARTVAQQMQPKAEAAFAAAASKIASGG